MIKKTSSALRLLSSQFKNTRVLTSPRVILNTLEENHWTKLESQPRFFFSEQNKDPKTNEQQTNTTAEAEAVEEDITKQIDTVITGLTLLINRFSKL